jgi:hypothetical protein
MVKYTIQYYIGYHGSLSSEQSRSGGPCLGEMWLVVMVLALS